jgi:hypothetical protein
MKDSLIRDNIREFFWREIWNWLWYLNNPMDNRSKEDFSSSENEAFRTIANNFENMGFEDGSMG